MRPDMAKVVTERPRRGHRERSKKWGKRLHWSEFGLDDHGPSRAPISRRRQYGWDAKDLTDLLGPIKGYLRKQSGRLWDDVYSEMAEHLDKRSVAGLHIFRHFLDYVEREVIEKDGLLYFFPAYNYFQMYVDPTNGRLYQTPRRVDNYRPKREGDIIIMDEDHQYYRKNGIWFLRTRHSKPDCTIANEKMVLTTEGGVEIVRNLNKFTRFFWIEEQLSKKDLKRAGLKNFASGNSPHRPIKGTVKPIWS